MEAAQTKWNFLPFKPGLVGGHCIGVDPYYLTHKAQQVGYHPNMILAGRRLNDNMGIYVGSQIIKLLAKKRINISNARILILGLTFKENCPDLRNTKVIDIINELREFNIEVDVYDPWVNPQEAVECYQVKVIKHLTPNTYDGVVVAVAHDQFKAMEMNDFRTMACDASTHLEIRTECELLNEKFNIIVDCEGW